MRLPENIGFLTLVRLLPLDERAVKLISLNKKRHVTERAKRRDSHWRG